MDERPLAQLSHLRSDVARAVNGRWWRLISVPISPGVLSVAGYRISRALFLRFGPAWSLLHALLAPVRMLTRPFGAGLEIHYRARIGPGLLVLHPGLGVVITGEATIGPDLTLTGGNCVGTRPGTHRGRSLMIGDGVTLGANAVVLGPATVGDRAVVGAGAVVIGDVAVATTVAGVPAKVVRPVPP